MARNLTLILALLGACLGSTPLRANTPRLIIEESVPDDSLRLDSKVVIGEKIWCWSNGPVFGLDHPLRRKINQTFESGPYFWAHVSCGGGNASKCQGWQVFDRRDGRWLGMLTGRWDGSKIVVYENGVFFDTGDALEINPLLAHYASPRYVTAWRDQNGLKLDRDLTWKLNASKGPDGRDKAARLLYYSGLAKLCQRPKDLKINLERAKKQLPLDRYKALLESLEQIKPDAGPNPFIPARPCKP